MNRSDLYIKYRYVIKIPKDKSALFIFGVSVGFIALKSIVPFLYGIQLLFLLYMGIHGWKKRGKLFTNMYTITYGLFLIWCALSSYWAPAANQAINTTISVGQMIIICSLLTIYFDSFDNIEKTIKGFAIASIIMLLYLFLKTPISEWRYALYGSFSASTDEGRIGYSIGFHPNAMGNLCAMLIFIWVYLYDISKKKIHLFWILLLSIVLLFTKSRASILMVLLEVSGYIYLCKKRKYGIIKILPMLAIVSVILYWAIFNIPILYHLIGFRMEGLLGIFRASGAGDASAYTRLNMMKYGMDMFKKNPISGVGFGNYGYYAYRYYGLFAQTYAHSNYIELLADLGIIGFILYYMVPVYCCVHLGLQLLSVRESERKLCAFLFVNIFVRLLMDTVKITYDDELAQMLNVICYCGMILLCGKKKSKKNKNTRNHNGEGDNEFQTIFEQN